MAEKNIYAFGGGTAEGRGDQKELLGGKGAGLAEMSGLGIPVPPGFTITTEVCKEYHRNDRNYPDGLMAEFDRHLERLEELLEKGFGDPSNPLLLSVRSGGPVSMPGMMDTILNLGLNDEIVAAMIEAGRDTRFVRDCYRRLVQMYGDVVLEVPFDEFEAILRAARERHGVEHDWELSADALAELTTAYLALIESRGKPFPSDPKEQLLGAVNAVFESWENQRARDYRRLHGLTDDSGTGVNVQAMVFGNQGPDCATGVAFTRDPSTGENQVYGEYLANAQGEDVVAGIRTPHSIVSIDGEREGLDKEFSEAYEELVAICAKLEDHRREMQDVEFTIERRKLYMLQTRDGKRTGLAAAKIAVDMVAEGRITPEEAVERVSGDQLAQLLAPVFDPEDKARCIEAGGLLARGLSAGPGAASGRIALTADRAAEMAKDGPVILVRDETSPEDIVGMHASAGILTSRGGSTSHAAIVARGLGTPCIVGAGAITVDEAANEVRVGDRAFNEGDEFSIEGSTGEVLAGSVTVIPPEVIQVVVDGKESDTPKVHLFSQLMGWSDDCRRMRVRANADTPHDATVARKLGAEGIGLCRTEHMFFEEDRIAWIRQVILSDDPQVRDTALAALLPVQQSDFEGILEAMEGLPVTIRLLDPPLHEFLPSDSKALGQLAEQMGIDPTAVADKAEALAEFNPMLGHRGCRLGLTTPEIYDTQVEAITRAACSLAARGVDAQPEIMVPLIGTVEEMVRLRERASAVVERVQAELSSELAIPIGTMIEIPRAALVADRIAEHADFFSFGTNDLTQMTFGYSRDDASRFLPEYVESGILAGDPFESLDTEGVGQLVAMATEKGRATKDGLKIGICGEHGGEPSSITFFESCGLDYVSCSPYRVPIARLAAARAKLGSA